MKITDYAHMNVFDVISDIDEPFLLHWLPSVGDIPGTWRVNLRVGEHSFFGQNTDEALSIREAIQRYLLRYPEGHRQGE